MFSWLLKIYSSILKAVVSVLYLIWTTSYSMRAHLLKTR